MRAVLAFVLAAAWPAFASINPPPPYFENTAMDGQGILWVYSRAEYNHIYSFDGTTWLESAPPFAQSHSAMPAFVLRMNDGAVACIWRVEPHTVAVTRHTLNGATVLGTCDGEINGGGLFCGPFVDSKNRIWITTETPAIYRCDATGVKLIHTIALDEYRVPNPHPDGYNPAHAVEDGHGRIWVWTDPQAGNYSSMRGVLIFTGDTPVVQTKFGNIDPINILAIARADDRHMWISVANDGLYQVDIDNFTLQREPDPAPKALCCVHELHLEGADLFAVEDQRGGNNHALWRRHAGVWQEVADPIGSYPFWPRSWLNVPQGLLVEGDEPNSLWFIPPDGTGAPLSWRSGFPLSLAHGLARLANGNIFALGNGAKMFDAPLTLPPHDAENSRLVWVPAQRGWKMDAKGRVWAILKDSPQMLSQWDGDKWNGHPIPGVTPPNQVPWMQPDILGQMWVMPATRDGEIRIYNPDTDKWQVFPNLNTAYIALAHQPPRFLSTGVIDDENPYYAPGLKRLAYRDGVTWINYYDGTTWTRITQKDIAGKGDDAIGPPFFDASGTLFVNIRPHSSYRMDAPGKWTEIPYHSLYPEDQWSESGNGHRRFNPYRDDPPEGAPKPFDFCVKDNVGTWWLTANGQLYRCAPSIAVPQFDPGEVNPFVGHAGLGHVFVDKNGNALFEFGSETDPFLMLRPKEPPPHTAIALQRTAPDSYIAHLDPKTSGTVTFRWQLDGGAWQQGADHDLALDHLPNGSHTLNVTAMTASLNIQAAPSVATFSTNVDATDQIAELLAQLAGPDYAQRKAAVEALALQPARAIPALEKARSKATGDTQWWIDVAIQEARDHAASAK